jgi:hemerythrin-like domain-containing protein
MNGIFQIGSSPTSTKPLSLLTNCHRRIEAALDALSQVAAGARTLTPDSRAALERSLRFFRDMGPKHTADEEQSLFPRLRTLGQGLEQLSALEGDHHAAEAWHAEVEQIGNAWLESGTLSQEQGELLSDLVAKLNCLYREHIHLEDTVVFPLAERVLSHEQQEEVRREMNSRRAITIQVATLLLLVSLGTGWAQTKVGSVVLSGSVRTRVEAWDWFSNGQGENQYAFSGTFARFGVSQARKALDWQVELAAPLLLGLPDAAVAPGVAGALGLGANYFASNQRNRNAAFVFLKQANIRFKGLGGDDRNSLKVGRFEFNDGTEVVSKDATLVALKRDRVAQRLIGNFGWTHVGRSLDGIHFVSNRKVAVHFVGAIPTRGVFQVDGWGPLRTGFAYLSLNRAVGKSDWRLFGIYYHDWRQVLKTDNRPLPLRRDDLGNIRLGSYGGHYLFAQPTQTSGTFDLMLWGLLQNGRWGRLDHRATAIAAEAGWQPPVLPKLRPWIRGGYFYGSGDGNPNDQRHGTFFQLLPTPRPFARFPFFNLMNNQDVHGSLTLRPSKAVTLRTESHHLRLSSGADQWLLGGGAFQPWSFGYVGRPSGATGGRPGLANLYDLSLDWNVNSSVMLSGYYGHAQGIQVIESIYAKKKNANFAYLELSYRF